MIIFIFGMVIIICVSCIHIFYGILNDVLIKYIIVITIRKSLLALWQMILASVNNNKYIDIFYVAE